MKNLKPFIDFIPYSYRIIEKSDPIVGTGKKPKGSGRRLYTDENPKDTVSVKFRTKQNIINTLNKSDFKSKSHQRKSQIINLIHQRIRVALQRAKNPGVKKRLRKGFEYIELKKEESKRKTEKMRNILEYEKFILEKKKNPCWPGYKQIGTKKKNGRIVPNCVKENS